MSDYFWHRENETTPRGPLLFEKLREMAKSGELKRRDQVWLEGWDQWRDAYTVEGLFNMPPAIASENGDKEIESPNPLNTDASQIVGPPPIKRPLISEAPNPVLQSQLVEQSSMVDLADVERGGKWAKWFGVVKIASVVLLLWIIEVLDIPIELLEGGSSWDLIIPLFVGSLSFYLGLKLLDPATRKSGHFSLLIWLYGFATMLSILGWVAIALEKGPGPNGIIGSILNAFAVWIFVQGRRQLREYESTRGTETSRVRSVLGADKGEMTVRRKEICSTRRRKK